MLWRCWDEEGREHGLDITADNEGEAAEAFAERRLEGNDHFDSIDVNVAEWGSGDSSPVKTFCVTVDFEPTFYAEEKK